MKYTFFLTILLLASACGGSKTGKNTANEDMRMTFIVTGIQDEMDGQTISMEDGNGGRYTTVISIPNGNWVELKVGDEISLIAEAIMESYPAQVIAKDIQVIGQANAIKATISTNKSAYQSGEAITLSMELKNTGRKPYTFLPWGTPLENTFTGDCLEITYGRGTLPYRGIMVKRMAPTDADYITLETGATASGAVNVLDGYDLSAPGKYRIQLKETYQGLPASNVVEIEVE